MSKAEITPDFFIVGAPKCGTTAFDSYLNSHPKVNMLPKEIHYWGDDLKYREENHSLKDFYYSELKNAEKANTLIGEGAVWYLVSEKAASELKSFSPDAKILIFLRNPIEAIYSLYYNTHFNGDDTSESFEKALANQKLRETSLPEFYNCPTIAFQYQRIYAYYEQVKRYYDVFGKENVKIVLYEEFVKEKQKTYNDVLNFLGLDSFEIDFKIINANKKIRSKSIRSLIYKPKKGIKNLIKFIIPVKSWREFLKLKLTSANSKETTRPEMKAETKKMLQEHFKHDIEKLEILTEKDLSFWK